MRQAIRASALVLALSCTAYAGEIPNGVTGTPPSQPATAYTTQEPVNDQSSPASELSVTEAVLNLVQNLLTLL